MMLDNLFVLQFALYLVTESALFKILFYNVVGFTHSSQFSQYLVDVAICLVGTALFNILFSS